MKGIVVGSVAEFDKQLTFRSTRPVFSVAQDTAPLFSVSGQLWYDTANDSLKVWDQEDNQFYTVGGEDTPEVDFDPINDRLDNIEQLQRDLHNIVSESVYNTPSFILEEPTPQIGQYVLGWDAPAGQGKWSTPPDFDVADRIRIAAVAGANSHLERAGVGDTLTIKSSALAPVVSIRSSIWEGSARAYYEMGLTFIEGLADGYRQRSDQVIKAADEETATNSRKSLTATASTWAMATA